MYIDNINVFLYFRGLHLVRYKSVIAAPTLMAYVQWLEKILHHTIAIQMEAYLGIPFCMININIKTFTTSALHKAHH